MLAKRAKAIERSLSALATVGPCLEFNSHVVPGMQELAALQCDRELTITESYVLNLLTLKHIVVVIPKIF